MATNITCRICDAQAASHEDAVLLCDYCRSNADAMALQIEDVLQQAESRMTNLLSELSTADTKRYKALVQARWDAKRAGVMVFFDKRYQATVAKGDALSILLEAEAELLRLRQWAERARQELDALEGVAV